MTIKETNESHNNSNKNNNSSGADQSKLKTTKGTTSTISHDVDTDTNTNTPVEIDNQKVNTHHHHQQHQPTKKRTKKIPRKQQRMKRKGIHFHNGKITSSNCNSNSHLIKRTLECIDISKATARQSNDHEKTLNSDINASSMDQVKEQRVEPDQKTLEEILQTFSIKGSESREIDVNPLNKMLPQTTQEQKLVLKELINDNHKVLSSTGTNIPSNNLGGSSTMPPKETQATCINSMLKTSQRDDIDKNTPPVGA
jgi:hypothetical protein